MIIETSYRPDYPLNQFVDFIWVGVAPMIERAADHHAALFTELIFNFGDDFQMTGQNISVITNNQVHYILSGLKTEPFRTEVTGKYTSVGLILKPNCYGLLTDKMNSREMERIAEIIHDELTTSIQPNFQSIESRLLSLFRAKPQHELLTHFERFISTQSLSNGALKEFTSTIPISQKSFIQQFKKYYAITPNDYINLKKIDTALTFMKKRNSESLLHIGLDAGFYDQSHFIKVFKKYCGATPRNFIKKL